MAAQRLSLVFWALVASCVAPPAVPSLGAQSLEISPEPPTIHLDYGKPQPAGLLLLGTAIAFPFLCGSLGTVLFLANTLSQTTGVIPLVSAVYSVKTGGRPNSIRYDPNASGLRQIHTSSQIFASDSRVVLSVTALTADEELNDKNRKPHQFLLFFDTKGAFLHSAAVDLPFPVAAIGLFESGEVLVVGSTMIERRQHWIVLDEDGSVRRDLMPARDDSGDKKLEGKELSEAWTSMTGVPQVLQYRGHLLLLEMNTSHPIVEINERGVMKSTELKLAKGETLGEFIPSDGRTWKVILGHTAKEGSTENGTPAGMFDMDKIAEFDPNTGELLRYVDPGKDHYPISLACEQDGAFIALKTNPKDGSLTIERGTPAQ
jgi:hypothetical protein